MTKQAQILVVLMILMLILAACGGGTQEATPTSVPPTAAEPTRTAAPTIEPTPTQELASMTLEELQTVQGFNLNTIKLLLPFVKVNTDVDSPQLTFNDLLTKGENQLFIRVERVLQEKEGFLPTTDSALLASPNSRYLGDRNHIFTRYKYNYGNHISFGFTAGRC